jgi:hypothetical protein
MSVRALWLVVFFCSGCDAGGSGGETRAAGAPPGWEVVTALAGGASRPRVMASLPGRMTKTGETGIDSQIASYAGPGLHVRFDYGAEGQPGCAARAAGCEIRNVELAGRPAVLAVSAAPPADEPHRVVYSYFAAMPAEAGAGGASPGGAGLLLTVKCAEKRTCPAEEIASTVRLVGLTR